MKSVLNGYPNMARNPVTQKFESVDEKWFAFYLAQNDNVVIKKSTRRHRQCGNEFHAKVNCIFRFASQALCAISLICVTIAANAVSADLFVYSDSIKINKLKFNALPEGSTQAKTGSGKSHTLSGFTAHLNKRALFEKSLRLNFPSKTVEAKRLAKRVAIRNGFADRYSFINQAGSMLVKRFSNDTIREIIIHDTPAKLILIGTRSRGDEFTFKRKKIGQFICDEMTHHDLVEADVKTNPSGISFESGTEELSLAKVLALQSRPNSSKVIYIDYEGGTLTGTAWNDTYNYGKPINYNAYSYDTNLSNFSAIDRHAIYSGWAEIAEDFAPFSVNVTTSRSVYNQASRENRSRIIATNSQDWLRDDNGQLVGGTAFIGSFGTPSDYYSIGWSFNQTMTTMGMTHSHEAGHQVGLSHDTDGELPYYTGHNNWGPVMGAPFGADIVQWSIGDYPGGTNKQDDLKIISDFLGQAPDNAGETNASATPLTEGKTIGHIRPSGLGMDLDTYKITISNRTNTIIQVSTLNRGNNEFIQQVNLTAKITLRSSTGAIIATKEPTPEILKNDFKFDGTLEKGTYFLTIRQKSYNPNPINGFTGYANGGYYKITFEQNPNINITPVLLLLLDDV